MNNSIILATWIKPDLVEVSRQVSIPHDIDPRTLTDSDIWNLCYEKGFDIYGSLSWEILINGSWSSHQTETQVRANRLYEKLADKLLLDHEAMESLHELYEIAHDNADRYYD